MRKLLSAGFIILIVLVAIIVIAPYTFLPGLLESSVAGNLRDQLGLKERPAVDLESEPPLGMLSGEFDQGTVEIPDYDIGDGVLADKVTINLDAFDVNVLDSVTGGELKAKEPPSGTLEAELSEQDVLKIARARVEDFPVNDVQLEEGRVLVASEVQLFGIAAPVSVEGGLDARENVMTFTPGQVEAFGVPLPGDVTEALLGGTDFEYPLSGLPEGTTVTDLTVNKDGMTLQGDVERVALG